MIRTTATILAIAAGVMFTGACTNSQPEATPAPTSTTTRTWTIDKCLNTADDLSLDMYNLSDMADNVDVTDSWEVEKLLDYGDALVQRGRQFVSNCYGYAPDVVSNLDDILDEIAYNIDGLRELTN